MRRAGLIALLALLAAAACEGKPSATATAEGNAAPAAGAPAAGQGAPAAGQAVEARGSAPTPWVKARAPENAPLLEAPAVVLAAPGASGAVSAPFAARVAKIHAQPGQAVERGAPVVDVIMPELISAAGRWAAAGTRIAAHRRRKEQLEKLRADGLAKLADLGEVEAALADALADQQIAAATLKSAGMGPGEAGRVLASGGVVTLRSPVAGVVTELRASLGETRDPAGEPLARVAGAGAARVEARLAARPPEGARYSFVVGAGAPVPLRKVSEAPALDARDGTIRIWLEADGALSAPAGALGKVRVDVDPGSGAVLVPAAAVALSGGRPVVVPRRTGRPLPVEVLATSGAGALIRGEIAAGDELAAEASRAIAVGGEEASP